jgi:hypothetical protein
MRHHVDYNRYDDLHKIDRTSCLGGYKVENNIPLNPQGRTGLAGRGNLLYWGPNHVFQIVFTRFFFH